MRHLVIGTGNLGLDIEGVLKQIGHRVDVLSGSRGNEFPAHKITSLSMYDHVWCCVGAGSVESAEDDISKQVQLHIELPARIAELAGRSFKQTVAHFFSTDYLNEPGIVARSLYARTKLAMEALLMGFDANIRIYRVDSLYGVHKPLSTFPGKVMKNQSQVLPANECTPTPTAWLAAALVIQAVEYKGKERQILTTVAPSGKTTVAEWGKLVLGRDVVTGMPDPKRPHRIQEGAMSLMCPNWRDLWEKESPRLLPAVVEALRQEGQ